MPDFDDLRSRFIRRLEHNKSSRIKTVTVPPFSKDGQDGDMQICRGVLYIKSNNEWFEFVKKPQFQIKKIGIGANTGTSQQELKYTGVANLENDLRTLSETVNKIIELLKLDIK
jgi:hypothetical protein